MRATTVVLSAGTLGSPELLRRSGIGPADTVRAAGLEVLVDLPGLRAAGANHAAVNLGYQPRPGVDVGDSPLLQGALHLTTPAGTAVEVLAMCRSYGAASGDPPTTPRCRCGSHRWRADPTSWRGARGDRAGALGRVSRR